MQLTALQFNGTYDSVHTKKSPQLIRGALGGCDTLVDSEFIRKRCMQVGTWLDFLRDISQKSSGCRVLIIDAPPDWNNAQTYEPEELPVLQVSVDREANEVALHTERDEDGPFVVPSPMLLLDLVAELERAADGTFEMLWVSGWQRLPEEEFDAEQDGEGPYRARLAAPLIGIGHTDDPANVIFIRERSRSDRASE